MEEYRFEEKRHRHELLVDNEWRSLTGCTTVLSVLAKPALIQWSANMAVEYIASHIGEAITYPLDSLKIEEMLNEAKVAHRKKKEKAGDWGTEMHAWVEKYINFLLGKNELPELPKDEIQQKQTVNFIKWVEDNKVKFIASEEHVHSKEMFTGGIIDILCEIDGEDWIADIKTSSGIYPEAFAQMAGYQLMLEEMEPDTKIKGHIVLNLRKDGEFEEKRSVSVGEAKEMFLSCLKIYRIQEKIKNQII